MNRSVLLDKSPQIKDFINGNTQYNLKHVLIIHFLSFHNIIHCLKKGLCFTHTQESSLNHRSEDYVMIPAVEYSPFNISMIYLFKAKSKFSIIYTL